METPFCILDCITTPFTFVVFLIIFALKIQGGIKLNGGTFNIFGPQRKVLHSGFDILPWILWGNGPDDPTTFQDRLFLSWLGLKMLDAEEDCDALRKK